MPEHLMWMVCCLRAQVCNDAIALLFMFDLSRKSTLSSVKEWYRQARLLNKSAVPFLIGTKFDIYSQQDEQDREETLKQVRFLACL
jgi:GTP-binding protein of the ras superfamily involved in termination of M-phase